MVTALQLFVSLAQGPWWLSVAIRALLCAVGKRPFVMANGLMTNTRAYSQEQTRRLASERDAGRAAD